MQRAWRPAGGGAVAVLLAAAALAAAVGREMLVREQAGDMSDGLARAEAMLAARRAHLADAGRLPGRRR